MSDLNYIVWVGGIPNYFEQKIDAEIDSNFWKSNGYIDVIIEKI